MDVQRDMTASLLERSERVPSPTAGRSPQGDATKGRRASGTSKFRRLRTGRACVTCHARKVRCDAASLGIPCTNCAAFSMECKVPTRNAKRTSGRNTDHLKQNVGQAGTSNPNLQSPEDGFRKRRAKNPTVAVSELPLSSHTAPLVELQVEQQSEDTKYYAKLIKREIFEAPIKEAGRVVYLEESSNMSLLVSDYNSTAGIVHYPMLESAEIGKSCSTKMDKTELCILRRRGALYLPPRAVSDDLIKTYFDWVAPLMPIINRTRFMRQYRDPNNPPSILLLQAVFLAGARACTNTQLMDSTGSTIPAAMSFYKRAKALYEANYEDDRIAIVQALILMGWYWEESGKVSKNVFYWNGLAVTIAQGFGMHRNAKDSRLSNADKRLWKRIWWTLFTRDRSVAVALGRPAHINMEDSDVEMLTEDDFVDDDDDDFQAAHLLPDQLQVQFFLQYVKICEVIDLVLLQNYSVASKGRRRDALALTQCDMALADWLESCPSELRWEQSRHHFWSALLFSVYYTTSCLLHRSYLPAAPSHRGEHHKTTSGDYPRLPPRNPALQAAHAITSIVETLSDYNELRFSPPFMVYSLSSALLIHVYQLHVAMPNTDVMTQNRIRICIAGLEQISKIWLVARMIQNLYESILSQKGLGDFLKDGVGRVHDNSGDLSDGRSHDLGPRKNYDTALQSEKSSKGREPAGSALTPALLAHLFAALKSATSSSSSENGDPVTEIVDRSNATRSKQTSHLNSFARREFCNSNFDTQSIPPVSQHSMEGLRGDQPIKVQTPPNTHISQQVPLDHNSTMYTISQATGTEDLSTQGVQLLHDRGFMQSDVIGSQYFTNEVGVLPYGDPVIQGGYHAAGMDYTSINTTTAGPPAPTGPNVLEWIQYFGIGNYQ